MVYQAYILCQAKGEAPRYQDRKTVPLTYGQRCFEVRGLVINCINKLVQSVNVLIKVLIKIWIESSSELGGEWTDKVPSGWMNELKLKRRNYHSKAQLKFWEREGTEVKPDLQERNQENLRDQLSFHVNKIQTCGYETTCIPEKENESKFWKKASPD